MFSSTANQKGDRSKLGDDSAAMQKRSLFKSPVIVNAGSRMRLPALSRHYGCLQRTGELLSALRVVFRTSIPEFFGRGTGKCANT
ncbi:MAG: hypothetical protein AAF892_02860 [Cyanobacteria bacterium P01_D01_bin.71]